MAGCRSRRVAEDELAVMRFFWMYVTVILAAYALSASWSLHAAGDRLTATELQAAQLSDELNAAQAKLKSFEQRESCLSSPEACTSYYH